MGALGFDEFVEEVRPRLARAFVAAFGPERGEEALAEALAYAWQHFDAVVAMGNPAGFLYRVGQSQTRLRKRPPVYPPPSDVGLPSVEPRLGEALGDLTERQRVCVVLVSGFEWTYQEVADLLDLSRSSVQNHVERGMQHLREAIGVGNDA